MSLCNSSDEEEVSSDENEAIEVKALMALANEERVSVGKESASNAENSNMSITSSNKPRLSKAEDSTLPNHDTSKVPSDESQRNTTNPLVAVFDSSTTDYDSTNKSSVCSTPLPPLEKLAGFTLKEPSSTPAKDNRKGTSASKTFSAPAGKLKNVKIEDDPPLVTMMKELNELKLQLSKNKKKEALKAQKAGVNKIVSSNVQRSKTLTKRLLAQIWELPGPEVMYGDESTYTTSI
ncbi:hypothetical protein Tco_0782346 [Tanacetum coccineum]